MIGRVRRRSFAGLVAALGLATALTACKAGPKGPLVDDEPSAPVPAAGWEYKSDPTTSWACVKSVDDAAELCFRKMQGHLDSYLKLSEEGNPFFCYAGHCEAKIKIDSGAEQTMQGTDDVDGGTRVLFLPGPTKILAQVRHAREFAIRPPMFGRDQTFVFKVDGLKWQ
jgi:predicted small lipoprotein YifL